MIRRRARPLAYRGLSELAAAPHVMVDGAPRPGTVLTLSHWPASPTPPRLARDVSTEIALAHLEAPAALHGASAVTCDHLDEDGLASLFVLSDPVAAGRLAGALVDFARAGDFDAAPTRRAIRQVYAFETLVGRERSPWADPALGADAWVTRSYRELLALLPELLEHPERFEWAWAEADERYADSLAALEREAASVVEEPDLDLARVVFHESDGESLAGPDRTPLARHALHGATAMARIACSNGFRHSYWDRYESWVRFTSRPIPRRRDLAPLAEELSALERDGARWHADPPGKLVAALVLADGAESSLDFETFVALVRRHLATAPPAWDPARPDGALVVASAAGADAALGEAAQHF